VTAKRRSQSATQLEAIAVKLAQCRILATNAGFSFTAFLVDMAIADIFERMHPGDKTVDPTGGPSYHLDFIKRLM
jgi:hypothetical protein